MEFCASMRDRICPMLCLAGINPLTTPMATECTLVWAGGIRIFQIILLTVEGPGFHWNPSISFTLSMVNVLFVRAFRAGMSSLSAGVGYKF